jgi:hypothetical protein
LKGDSSSSDSNLSDSSTPMLASAVGNALVNAKEDDMTRQSSPRDYHEDAVCGVRTGEEVAYSSSSMMERASGGALASTRQGDRKRDFLQEYEPGEARTGCWSEAACWVEDAREDALASMFVLACGPCCPGTGTLIMWPACQAYPFLLPRVPEKSVGLDHLVTLLGSKDIGLDMARVWEREMGTNDLEVSRLRVGWCGKLVCGSWKFYVDESGRLGSLVTTNAWFFQETEQSDCMKISGWIKISGSDVR